MRLEALPTSRDGGQQPAVLGRAVVGTVNYATFKQRITRGKRPVLDHPATPFSYIVHSEAFY